MEFRSFRDVLDGMYYSVKVLMPGIVFAIFAMVIEPKDLFMAIIAIFVLMVCTVKLLFDIWSEEIK